MKICAPRLGDITTSTRRQTTTMYSASLPIFDYGGGGGDGDGDGGGGEDDDGEERVSRVGAVEEKEEAATVPISGTTSSSAVARGGTVTGGGNVMIAPTAGTAVATDYDGDDRDAAIRIRIAAAEAIEPPDEVQDLVSRAQWQWALGESEKASPTRVGSQGDDEAHGHYYSAGGGEGTENVNTTATTKNPATTAASSAASSAAAAPLKRPQIRPQKRPPAPVEGVRRTTTTTTGGGGIKLPPALSRSTNTAAKLPPSIAAKAAVAEEQIASRREKLRVVERLMSGPAESREHLMGLVRGMSGEEFLGICEERCLAGLCGWPLCSRGNLYEPQQQKFPQRRSKYRIDSKERKVYLRRDLEMFCCDDHRSQAESLGTSLEIRLVDGGDEDDGESGERREGAHTAASGVALGKYSDTGSDGESGGEQEQRRRQRQGPDDLSREEEAAAAAARQRRAATKEAAIGNVNVNVKMDVIEKMPPKGVTAPAPTAPSLSDTSASSSRVAANSVEGFVPRRPKSALKLKSTTRTSGGSDRGGGGGGESESESGGEAVKVKSDEKKSDDSGFWGGGGGGRGKGAGVNGKKVSPGVTFNTALEMGPTGSAYNKKALDSHRREDDEANRAAGKPTGENKKTVAISEAEMAAATTVTSTAATPDNDGGDGGFDGFTTATTGGGGGAQFYFDFFQEGTEKATKKGANMMGTYSEGQLSRVVPAAMDVEPPSPPREIDDDVNEAMEAAEAAAKAAEAATARGDAAAAAAQEEALAQAREALKRALTRAGAEGGGGGGGEGGQEKNKNDEEEEDDYLTDDGATTDADDDSSVGGGGGAPTLSEFGLTWMLLDGWVTRATFHYLSGGVLGGGARAGGDKDGDDEKSGGGAPPDLPPRSGFAGAMSKAAAVEITRALPSVCRSLGLRASPSSLERPLGKLLRTFFFHTAVPSLRPERWAFITAVMLEVVATRGVVQTGQQQQQDDRSPTLAEDLTRAASQPVTSTREGIAAEEGMEEEDEGEGEGGSKGGKPGSLAKLVAAAGATEDEHRMLKELLAGECAKEW